MTPERINTVIAEWCGWKQKPDQEHVDIESRAVYIIPDVMPNYYGDRNAFHSAYSRMTNSQKHAYLDNLLAIIDRRPVVYVLDAELPECCEALLRTIGRWEIERTK